jgi:quinol monooxygenase YgiN
MITIVSKATVKEEKVEEYLEIIHELINESRKEEGCIKYDLYQDLNNKNILTFIEEWKDQEAIKIHNESPHYTNIVPKLRLFREKSAEVNLYNLLDK